MSLTYCLCTGHCLSLLNIGMPLKYICFGYCYYVIYLFVSVLNVNHVLPFYFVKELMDLSTVEEASVDISALVGCFFF